MQIGFVGLGKLGLPCAVAAASRGHEVLGYDIAAERMSKMALTIERPAPTARFLCAQSTAEHSPLRNFGRGPRAR